MPRHVAIIMDGNGRWAKQHGLVRMFGHKKGVETVHNITEEAARLGIEYLTLYTFSTENWNRPKEEVDALMSLLVDTIVKETDTLMKNNVRLLTIGDLERLPKEARRKFESCMEETAGNTGLRLVIALSYSARWEIVNAVKQIASAVKAGTLRVEELVSIGMGFDWRNYRVTNHKMFAKDGRGIITMQDYPEGVEPKFSRIHTFSLSVPLKYYHYFNKNIFVAVGPELYFTPCLWPDFTVEEFRRAIADYQHRERRFGKTSEQLKN